MTIQSDQKKPGRPRGRVTVWAASVLAVAASLAITATAQAGDWETGTYSGKIYSESGGRPKTKIKLKVTDKKIKLLRAEFILECRNGGKVEFTARGGADRLTEGPAGAGFSINEQERNRRYQENYDLVGGVQGDVARGQISATRIYEDPYEDCNDDLLLAFKAKH